MYILNHIVAHFLALIYGKFNSHGFNKICKSWNIAIRTLLQLPFNAHTWLLGPITIQNNIQTQLYIRNYRFFCIMLVVLPMLLLNNVYAM